MKSSPGPVVLIYTQIGYINDLLTYLLTNNQAN